MIGFEGLLLGVLDHIAETTAYKTAVFYINLMHYQLRLIKANFHYRQTRTRTDLSTTRSLSKTTEDIQFHRALQITAAAAGVAIVYY
jgi:hypothetical protein